MGWWPSRRQRARPVADRVEAVPVQRFWRSLPPVQRAVPDVSLVTAPDAFTASLATVTVPAMLGVLTGTLRTSPATMLRADSAGAGDATAGPESGPRSSAGVTRWGPRIPIQRIMAAPILGESTVPVDTDVDDDVNDAVAEVRRPNPELMSADVHEEPRIVPVVMAPAPPTSAPPTSAPPTSAPPTPAPARMSMPAVSPASRSGTGRTSVPDPTVVQRLAEARSAEPDSSEGAASDDSAPGLLETVGPWASSDPLDSSAEPVVPTSSFPGPDTSVTPPLRMDKDRPAALPTSKQFLGGQRTTANLTDSAPPPRVVGEAPPHAPAPPVPVQRRPTGSAPEPEHDPALETADQIVEPASQPRNDNRRDSHPVTMPDAPIQVPAVINTPVFSIGASAVPTRMAAMSPEMSRSFGGSALVQRLVESAARTVPEAEMRPMPFPVHSNSSVERAGTGTTADAQRVRSEGVNDRRFLHEQAPSIPLQRQVPDPMRSSAMRTTIVPKVPLQRTIVDASAPAVHTVEPADASTVHDPDSIPSSREFQAPPTVSPPPIVHTEVVAAQRAAATIEPLSTVPGAIPTSPSPASVPVAGSVPGPARAPSPTPASATAPVRPASPGIGTSPAETVTFGPESVTETRAQNPVTATVPIVSPGDRSPDRTSTAGTAIQRVVTAPESLALPAPPMGTPSHSVPSRTIFGLGHVAVGAPVSLSPTDEGLGTSGWTIVRATDTSGVSLQRMFEHASQAEWEDSESASSGLSTPAASENSAMVQRETDASPASPGSSMSVSASDSTATPAAGAISPPGPGGGLPGGAGNLDELAARLYEPLATRLRAELWHDHERTGTLTDLGR